MYKRLPVVLRLRCFVSICYSELEMTKAAAKTTHSPSAPASFGLGGVALTFLDTTWRIATPVIVCTVLGIIADRSLGTKPWLTLAVAVPMGFVLAVLLVKRQLAAVEAFEERKKS
jgi:hypothetical protein